MNRIRSSSQRPPEVAPIRVLLADDHTIVRDGLCAILKSERGVKVVGEAATGPEAVRLAGELKPDVIVLDIAMPGLSGLHAADQILKQNDSTRIIILSMTGGKDIIAQAIQIGISGYLVKETAAQDLVTAIKQVHRGNAYFSPGVMKIVLEIHRSSTSNKEREMLSVFEQEILRLIASGKTSREIAEVLCTGMKTLLKQRQQIMDKLGIHNTAGLTRYAISQKIHVE